MLDEKLLEPTQSKVSKLLSSESVSKKLRTRLVLSLSMVFLEIEISFSRERKGNKSERRR